MPKKSFRDENPALTFISNKGQTADQAAPAIQDESLNSIIEAVTKPEEKKEENRSKRFSLAVQPSLYDDLSIAATIYRTNINDLCNSILTDYVNGRKEQIDRFRELSSQFLK